MVADKVAQQRGIFELYPVVAERTDDLEHGGACTVECCIDGVEQGVVEEAVHRVVLVRSDVGGIAVQDFSNGMHAGRAHKVRPEVLSDMLDRVNSDSIKVVFGNERLDPIVECANDAGILGVDIGQGDVLVTQPARFHLRLVRVVLHPTEAVEIPRRNIERSVAGVGLEVLSICGGNVVDDL